MIKKNFSMIKNNSSMIKKGFEDTNDLALIAKRGFDEMDERFEKFETGQRRIKMILMNIVYRSEFEKLKDKILILKKKISIT